MEISQAWSLLGGLSPQQFVKRHWQKKPLLVRQAWPGVQPPVSRAELFELAGQDDVESRLVLQQEGAPAWQLRRGPFQRRQLPALKRAGWSLLVQGLDLHVQQAHEMLSRFRFLPDARLDDLMISYATDGGGVGPHLDSYDVFLLQVHGRRRWRIGPVADDTLIDGLPVRILRNFHAQQEWVLEPGDLLYLPPRWGHDGVAEGECMTCSIGFRVPQLQALASELLARLAESDDVEGPLYRDPTQPATTQPACIPADLQAFAARAVRQRLQRSQDLNQVLGETLTEPKPLVWFEGAPPVPAGCGVQLDRRTRMMYDQTNVYINGESFRARGRDARWMAQLADQRGLAADQLQHLSPGARELLDEWVTSGWVRASGH